MNLFGYLVKLFGRGINPSEGLYLRRTTQHRKKRTHIHAPTGIRTRDASVRAVETVRVLDRTAIGTGIKDTYAC
jgi:hypothetical protein